MANIENKGQPFIEKGSYVKKETAIMRAEPFAAVLRLRYRGVRCDSCFKSCKMSRCSSCQYVYYCNRKCQRKSWSVHKMECLSLKKFNPSNPLLETAHMMARIIIKLQHGGHQERGYYSSDEYRTFEDLSSHMSDISKDAKRLEHFTLLCNIVVNFLPHEILPDRSEFLMIYGRMTSHCFDIMNFDHMSIGTGTYLGPSIIKHSCKPNAEAVFNGTTLALYAVRDIPSFDWSKVSISYVEHMLSIDERREKLLHYYIRCACPECENPDLVETAAACPNKSCTNPCFPDGLECSKCGQKFPPNFRENFEMIKERSLRYLEINEDERDLKDIQACLAEQEGLLHPLNKLHVRMLQIAVTPAIQLQLWKEAEIYSRKLIEKYEYYLGESNPITGHAYMTLASMLHCVDKSKEAFDLVNKHMDIIKIACGEADPELLNFLQFGFPMK